MMSTNKRKSASLPQGNGLESKKREIQSKVLKTVQVHQNRTRRCATFRGRTNPRWDFNATPVGARVFAGKVFEAPSMKAKASSVAKTTLVSPVPTSASREPLPDIARPAKRPRTEPAENSMVPKMNDESLVTNPASLLVGLRGASPTTPFINQANKNGIANLGNPFQGNKNGLSNLGNPLATKTALEALAVYPFWLTQPNPGPRLWEQKLPSVTPNSSTESTPTLQANIHRLGLVRRTSDSTLQKKLALKKNKGKKIFPEIKDADGKEIITEIGENDVLLGRGSATNRNEGNNRFRQLVRDNQMRYIDAVVPNKKTIVHEIVDKIKSRGGRYLLQVGEDKYIEVEPVKAREKTGQALREGLRQRAYQISRSEGCLPSNGKSTKKFEEAVFEEFRIQTTRERNSGQKNAYLDYLSQELEDYDLSEVCPNENDVICTLATGITHHPGNMRYNELMKKWRPHYQSLKKRSEKTMLSTQLVRTIQEAYGARFLRPKDNKFIELTPLEAREKVSHSLRVKKDNMLEEAASANTNE